MNTQPQEFQQLQTKTAKVTTQDTTKTSRQKHQDSVIAKIATTLLKKAVHSQQQSKDQVSKLNLAYKALQEEEPFVLENCKDAGLRAAVLLAPSSSEKAITLVDYLKRLLVLGQFESGHLISAYLLAAKIISKIPQGWAFCEYKVIAVSLYIT